MSAEADQDKKGNPLRDLAEPELRRYFLTKLEEKDSILLCSDYDGTLVGFTSSPEQTRTPEDVIELLQKAKSRQTLEVAVVSGRSLAELEKLLPIEGITLAGSHGVEIKFADGSTYRWEKAKAVETQIEKIRDLLQADFSNWKGILIEDKKISVALHYRQFDGSPCEVKNHFEAVVENQVGPKLEVLEGSKLLEIRPRGWDKGKAVEHLRERIGRDTAVIYLGDDTTDEDAFEALHSQQDCFSILIGEKGVKETHAGFRLRSPRQVKSFIRDLISAIEH
ncbi:MAG: trehalose-phosphatase [Candidatus Bipolaricaulota bacterium]